MKSRTGSTKGSSSRTSKRQSEECKIQSYYHCALCLKELPKTQSMRQFARLAIGPTAEGVQIWCNRHDVSVIHMRAIHINMEETPQ